MHPLATQSSCGTTRWPAAAALALLVAACGTSSTIDVQSLGLDVEADINAGSRFEITVPTQPDTTIEVVATPPGVTAWITDEGGGRSVRLTVAVEFDTPRGAYNLALRVTQNGQVSELGWPFEVTEPSGAATTLPPPAAPVLEVETPQVGEEFPSPSVISGLSSADTVGYKLVGAGGLVLAEGIIVVDGGEFRLELEFENTCCIEMLLEVFHLEEGGVSQGIPLAFPEPG